MTARQEILAAISALRHRNGEDTFTIQAVVDELAKRGSRYAEGTIRTHIASKMCAGAPVHHATTYDDLERVGHGLYRLRRA